MRTNGNVTLVSDEGLYVFPAWYEETNARGVSKQGYEASNIGNVLYSVEFQRPKKGDYIIRGEYSSGDIKTLLENGALKVTSISMLDFGSFPHYEVGLK